jgi:hypothetical protein
MPAPVPHLALSLAHLASCLGAAAGAALSAAGAGLDAALGLLAAEPAVTLVAAFFAGSAAGAVSTLVVLLLSWAAVRRLRR